MVPHRKPWAAVLAAALVAMLGIGMLTVSASVGSLDDGPLFFAQNGNGNGAPVNPGNSENAPGQQVDPPTGQPDGPGNSENAPGQQSAVPAEGEGGEDGPADARPEASGAEKVNVCHVTGEDGETVMISVSVNAVPAHEGHGDPAVGVTSEEECPEVEAPIEDEQPDATPIPDDGEGEGEEDDEDVIETPESGTPTPATPVATPLI